MRTLIVLLAASLWAAPACAQHDDHADSTDPPASVGHDDHGQGEAPAGGDLAALDPETRAIAMAEIEALRAAVARYEDHAAAVADGYQRFGRRSPSGAGNPLMGEHWYLPDEVQDALDLERPSTLIYATIDGEKRLVGVAWTLYQRPGESVPEGFAGDADHWHVHHVPALAAALVADRPLLARVVERRNKQGKLGAGDGRTELTMLHAWIGLDNPAGIFANDNVALPYARSGLPLEWASAENPATAKGVGLLLPDACPEGREEISSACEEAAAQVGAALEESRSGALDPAAFNAAAADAWRDYEGTVFASLTPEQRARIEALGAATTH